MKKVLILSGLAVTALVVGISTATWWFDAGSGAAEQRPDFALTDIQGDIRHVDEWDGKLLLLNFWATWCAPCRKEIPLLIQAQEDYAQQGLQIVGLAIDEPEPVRDYAERYGINYPLLVDAINVVKVQDALNGGSGLPVSILIDRKGRVRERVVGEMDRERLERLISPYLASQAKLN